MTGSAGSDDEAVGSADLTRGLIEDTRRLGVSMATRIADQFARHIPDTEDGPATQDAMRSFRLAQANTERAMDTAMSAVGDLTASYSELARQAIASVSGQSSGGTEVIDLTVARGASATQEVWIHNQTSEPSPPASIHVGDVISHDGAHASVRFRCEPDLPHVVGPGESAPFQISVEIDEEAPAGSYHALALVAGVPDAAVHLVLHVEEPDTAP